MAQAAVPGEESGGSAERVPPGMLPLTPVYLQEGQDAREADGSSAARAEQKAGHSLLHALAGFQSDWSIRQRTDLFQDWKISTSSRKNSGRPGHSGKADSSVGMQALFRDTPELAHLQSESAGSLESRGSALFERMKLEHGAGRTEGVLPGGTHPSAGPGTGIPGVWTQARLDHGGPYASLARELRQVRAAAKAMEKKAAPASMQTVELPTAKEQQQQQTIVWQNPYMRKGPVEMTQKPTQGQKRQQDAGPSQTRISDTEIRRVADKVFKLVEDRIVLERRRIGRY